MSDKKELNLLVDLAKLIEKYGPQAFERLSNRLSRPEFAENMAAVLSATAKQSRSLKRGSTCSKKKQTPSSFRSSLLQVGGLEPDKRAMLILLFDGLMSKQILPTLKDIQSFLSDSGLPRIKARARDKAIVPFVRLFVVIPVEEVKSHLKRIQTLSEKNDRSLQGWSDIIFRSGENQNGPKK